MRFSPKPLAGKGGKGGSRRRADSATGASTGGKKGGGGKKERDTVAIAGHQRDQWCISSADISAGSWSEGGGGGGGKRAPRRLRLLTSISFSFPLEGGEGNRRAPVRPIFWCLCSFNVAKKKGGEGEKQTGRGRRPPSYSPISPPPRRRQSAVRLAHEEKRIARSDPISFLKKIDIPRRGGKEKRKERKEKDPCW